MSPDVREALYRMLGGALVILIVGAWVMWTFNF
jgi:hypothetical protein